MKIRFLSLLVALSLMLPVTLNSCTPTYSITAVEQTNSGWQQTTALYESIMSSADKTHSAHASKYLAVYTIIDSIEITYATRKHTKTISAILSDIEARLHKYEKEHETYGSINNTMASIYKRNMDALWRNYYNAETHLNK